MGSFDAGSIIFNVVLTYGVCWFVNKYLDIKTDYPDQYKILSKLWIAAIPFTILLGFLSVVLDGSKFLLILFLFITILLSKYFNSDKVKNIFILFAPLVLFELLSIATSFFSEAMTKTLQGLSEACIFWFIGFGIYLWRQKRKDDVVKKKEADEKRLAEAKRNLLENLVSERTAELSQQKEALQKSMDELQATQTQLIHSEKMASLGELTAGIAHEIQNPLNFVNNFSEVNSDLLSEIKAELKKPISERDEKNLDDLLSDIEVNSQKITFHGHRAANIVKSMLDHSRKNSDQKELTDVNELCDEYIRISYHGLRAKDKAFNADFKLNLEKELPKILAIKQDLGRVLLNLVNNAFYSVYAEAQKTKGADASYKPLVTINTRSLKNSKGIADKIEIKVTDNGTGVDENIKDKIFQPFFTTKPTGQGTGLGLSLTYDLVTKGHKGELSLEPLEKGACFKVILPVSGEK